MLPILATLVCFALYLAGYHLYAKHLGHRIFQLDSQALTPAHDLQDGIDYVPTNKYVLFGHHYASIAGLSPMLGTRYCRDLGLDSSHALGRFRNTLYRSRPRLWSLGRFREGPRNVDRQGC